MPENPTIIIVGIGDIKTGQAPATIRTTLGSCIAVCLYEPATKIGGMLHLMMADSSIHSGSDAIRRAKYADTGIADLIDEMKKKHGIPASALRAKIFGGAKILAMVTQDIGKDNETATRNILAKYNIKILAAKTGGTKGYQVEFNLNTGMVGCRVFGQPLQEY